MSYFFTFGTKQFNNNTSIDIIADKKPFQNININNITISPSGTYPLNSDIQGTVTSDNINYNVCTFTNTTTTVTSYTLSYTALTECVCYVLAVGGGGAGSSYTGGGGGAGGVVMVPVTIPVGTNTITITVGNGGTGSGKNTFAGTAGNGSNTTVTFNATGVSIPNIVAYGGGAGAGGSATNSALSGASGGGTKNTNPGSSMGLAINYPYNYGNPGGFYRSGAVSGGGGGAGTPGCTLNTYPTSTTMYASGGNGLQCTLPGIKDFSPSGTAYGSYYWGGGGGGSASNTLVSNVFTNGGLGGGGGGGTVSAANNPTTTGGGSALYPGGDGAKINNGAGGNGGANTGGGGGGSWNGFGGNGGSGIVILSFPTTSVELFSTPKTTVLSNSSLSTSAKNTALGAFGCIPLNNNYYGPTMTLRANNDTYGALSANFYADSNGILWTGYGNNRTKLQDWLNYSRNADQTYAYVTMWYDQSMYAATVNNALQNNPSYQPIYDVANTYLNFGYTGADGGIISPNATCYLTLPNGAMPYNDSSFCYILKHYNVGTTNTYAGFLSGGTNASNQAYMLMANAASAGYYGTQVNSTVTYNNLIYTNSIKPNNVITSAYKSFSTGGGAYNWMFYINDYSATTTVSSALAITNNNVSIGASVNGWNTNCCAAQIEYLFMFSSALTTADQLVIKQNAGGYITNSYLLGTTSASNIFNIGANPITTPVTSANLNGWNFTATSTTTIGGGGVILNNSYNSIAAPAIGNLLYCYFGKSGGTTLVSYYYFSQNLVLYPGTYTLTYYIRARPTYYQTAQKVFATINGYTNTPASATTSWVQQTLTFNIVSYGTYSLTINIENGIGLTDSAVAISQITMQ